jgi:type I restriction enzyme, S subunit
VIEDLQPYPEMRDSGVLWLEEVPKDWDVLRGRQLFEIKKRIVGELGPPIISITQEGLRVKDVESGEGQLSQDYSKYQTIDVGEFAMNSMDLLTGGVGIADRPGVTSPDYRVFVLRDESRCCDRYMLQVLRMLYRNRGFYAWGQGSAQLGRWRLPRKRFNDFPFPVPSLEEQVAIVQFLDWAAGRLDRAIRVKRNVIAMFKEQKQAIIHRAVTRGVGPSVALKQSGNPWLGDIPQHWDQRALWTVSAVRTERNPGDLPLLSVFLNRGVIRYEEGGGQVHAPSLDLSNYQVVRIGDLVLNNQQAWRGSVGVSFHEGIISPAYIVLQMSPKFDTRFANYLMRSRVLVDQFVAASKGVGDIQRQVFWPFLRMVQVPLPTMSEQVAIVAHVEAATVGISASLSRLEREIELLREYRTRLTADVLTGKLDVREAATRLPDEALLDAEADEDLDEQTEAIDEEAVV